MTGRVFRATDEEEKVIVVEKFKARPGFAGFGTGGPEDYSQAQWLAIMMDHKWRYDHGSQTWHGFAGPGIWFPDHLDRVRYEVASLAAQALDPKSIHHVKDEPSRKAIMKLLTVASIDKALDALASFPDYGTDGTKWDQISHLIGVQNGIVDLRTSALRDGTPEDLVTKVCGAPYDPEAYKPERFLRFLDEIYPDPETVTFMKRAIGALLVGGYMKAFLLLLGDTDTGKSTLMNVLTELLGDYSCPLGIKSFAKPTWQGQSNAHTRDLMRLPGSRFAYAVESDEQTTLDVARIKAMTGGEPQLLAGLYQNERKHNVTWKLWFGTNTAPKVADESDATWTRMQSIPHPVRFWRADDDGKPAGAHIQDPYLWDDLREELPGILTLAVTWAREYVRSRGQLLPLPQSGLDLRTELHEDDEIAAWFEMEMRIDQGSECANPYPAYDQWAARHDEKAINQTLFGRRLVKRATSKRKVGPTVHYLGIRPATSAEKGG